MNYVFHLLKKKLTFKKNKKVDLLVLDDLFIEFDFKNLNYVIYNENEINLRYFFAIIFEFFFSKRKNFSFLKELYFKKVISSYNPKIVLGKDRYGFITKYKKHFPQKTSTRKNNPQIFILLLLFAFIKNRERLKNYKWTRWPMFFTYCKLIATIDLQERAW